MKCFGAVVLSQSLCLHRVGRARAYECVKRIIRSFHLQMHGIVYSFIQLYATESFNWEIQVHTTLESETERKAKPTNTISTHASRAHNKNPESKSMYAWIDIVVRYVVMWNVRIDAIGCTPMKRAKHSSRKVYRHPYTLSFAHRHPWHPLRLPQTTECALLIYANDWD